LPLPEVPGVLHCAIKDVLDGHELLDGVEAHVHWLIVAEGKAKGLANTGVPTPVCNPVEAVKEVLVEACGVVKEKPVGSLVEVERVLPDPLEGEDIEAKVSYVDNSRTRSRVSD
jgi:hypothetical protein